MPTPDERRKSWIEPGLTRLRETDGTVSGALIDLRRAHAYSGNGIDVIKTPTGDVVVLSADVIRRLARAVGV